MVSCPLGRWVNGSSSLWRDECHLAAPGRAGRFVVLETVGRSLHRVIAEVPVLAASEHGNKVIVGTVRRRSDWFANLSAARVGAGVARRRAPDR